MHDQFVHYLLRSAPYIALYGRISKGVRVSQWDLEHAALRAVPLLLPALPTQRAIAEYLDRETARIDNLTSRKKEALNLLSERETSVITLMTDRSPDEEMWHTKIGHFVCKVGSGKTPSGGATTYANSGVAFLRSQNIYNDGIRLDDVAFITEDVDAAMAGTRVQEGDVLLNITGGSIGRSAVAARNCLPANVNQHVCILRPSVRILSEYLHLCLLSDRVQSQIRILSFSGGREGLNFHAVRNLQICVPRSLEQQQKIVDLANASRCSMRTLRQLLETSVETAKDRRAALITAAVTGQLDVPLSASVEEVAA
jgi:type I restriction enzyme S subunit